MKAQYIALYQSMRDLIPIREILKEIMLEALNKKLKPECTVKLLPLPQPPLRPRTDARTNPSAQRATQLSSVLARVYAVSIQNQITTDVP
jgi:hypothetical protein